MWFNNFYCNTVVWPAAMYISAQGRPFKPSANCEIDINRNIKLWTLKWAHQDPQ